MDAHKVDDPYKHRDDLLEAMGGCKHKVGKKEKTVKENIQGQEEEGRAG